MSGKEEFIEIFREKITRPGADALLDYLEPPPPPDTTGPMRAGCVTTA